MRILVHDFSGHPFQADLARSLGARGHEVLHVHCDSYGSGRGAMGDEEGRTEFAAISLGRPFERYRARQRLRDEATYGRRFLRTAQGFRPDIVISCNDPLLAKAIFGIWAWRRRLPWVFWLQDVYSVAMDREARRRSRAGRLVGSALQAVERRLLRSAAAVVPITGDFDAILDSWAVPPASRTVIENWAPLAEVPLRPRTNTWRDGQRLGDRFVYLYAGTLGLKHDPDLLAALARAQPDAEVVVVSEGLGADHLRRVASEESLPNLRVVSFQPWEAVPDVLGSADVLIVLLEADAGTFSVPSKILTGLCAGRPILASIPLDNLGSRTILDAGAGLVVRPNEPESFVYAAKALRADPATRREMGRSARAHAERAFDIGPITDRFEQVIMSALTRQKEWSKGHS